MRTLVLASLVATCLLAGCASTKVEITGSQLKAPLCETGAPPVSTLVYWSSKWRPDQKEPARREAAALRGIQDFLRRSRCLSVLSVNRLATAQVPASDDALIRLASSANQKPERVLLIVVRELGPRLLLGLPVIEEGGTEVLVDVRVLDGTTAKSLANTQTLWRNGGRFVIKGVKTLDQDMSAALAATLMFNQDPR